MLPVILDAFTAGINAYLAIDLPLPFEFQLLGYEPEAWTPEDGHWLEITASTPLVACYILVSVASMA